MKEVKKRDGRVVDFDETKIELAIKKAMAETEKGIDESLVEKIIAKVKQKAEKSNLGVEEIQDFIELELMKSPRKEVAKVYIKYRNVRDLARKAKTSEALLSIMNIERTAESRENANMNASTPAGQVIKAADELTKIFADEFLMSEETLTAKKGNYIWVHDQNYMFTRSSTCLHHPLDRILENGFKAGHGEVRPVKRIETAMTIAAISLETIQNEQHGGQSLGAFDYYTAPYVKLTYHEEFEKASELYGYDINIDVRDREIDEYEIKNLSDISNPFERIRQHAINQTVKRVAQACEGFCHNMNNISSRGGNQVVFSSINYGTDTSAEGRAIIRQMLLATERGVGNGSTAIFPIQIYKLKKGYSYGVNKDGKRTNQDLYELACKVSAKRFYPNFLNLDSSFNHSESNRFEEGWNENDPKRYLHEVATMGKHLLLI